MSEFRKRLTEDLESNPGDFVVVSRKDLVDALDLLDRWDVWHEEFMEIVNKAAQ